MNIIANYVMNNIYRDVGSRLSEGLQALQHLLDTNQVNPDTVIERAIDEQKITIRDMLFEKYGSGFNNEVIEFLNKNNITKETNDEESYIALLNTLKSLKGEYIEHKAQEKIKAFMSLNIKPEKIVSYLHSEFSHEDMRNDFNRPEIFFNLMICSDLNTYLFKVIFEEYLGIENVKDLIKDFIVEKATTLTFSSVSNTIRLCNAYPEFRNINVKSHRINGKDMSLLEKLIVDSPDLTIKEIEASESEKMRLVEFFYDEKIKSVEDLSGASAIEVIKMKKDWFSTCLKDGKTDLVSVFTYRNSQDIGLVLSDLKNLELKQYLKEREENLLVEYLANKSGRYVKTHLNKIEKHLPELLTRENKKGVIGLLLNGFGYGQITEKETNFLKNYPSKILMTSDPEELLRFANRKVCIEYNSQDYQKKKQYDEVSTMIMSAVKENFEGKDCGMVREAIAKLELQDKISRLFRMSYSTFLENGINKEIENTIEKSGLSANQLSEVLSLENLVLNGYLDKNYIDRKRTYEERDVLLNSIASDDDLKVKKRI